MEYVTEWHCDYSHTGIVGVLDTYPVVTSSDCYATATSTGVATTSPILAHYVGDITFGLAILMILGGMVFMGLIFNSAKRKR